MRHARQQIVCDEKECLACFVSWPVLEGIQWPMTRRPRGCKGDKGRGDALQRPRPQAGSACPFGNNLDLAAWKIPSLSQASRSPAEGVAELGFSPTTPAVPERAVQLRPPGSKLIRRADPPHHRRPGAGFRAEARCVYKLRTFSATMEGCTRDKAAAVLRCKTLIRMSEIGRGGLVQDVLDGESITD